MNAKMLPIGVDDFKKIRTENFYYIDKTSLIKDLLLNRGGSKPVHTPPAFWQKPEYEYAPAFF